MYIFLKGPIRFRYWVTGHHSLLNCNVIPKTLYLYILFWGLHYNLIYIYHIYIYIYIYIIFFHPRTGIYFLSLLHSFTLSVSPFHNIKVLHYYLISPHMKCFPFTISYIHARVDINFAKLISSVHLTVHYLLL